MRTPGKVRIIGGRWRRRLLPVPDAPGLRPTPDRVRETLFNWLADDLPGASCLDLFAGSGVLGLEAASRGAARVVLLERDGRLVTNLQQQVALLQATDVVEVVSADALTWRPLAAETFEIVFVDPPYGVVDLPALLDSLLEHGVVGEHARVFVESDAGAPSKVLPEGWQVLREQRAGRVRYHLAAPPRAASDTQQG